ncbi:MAG: POTRA domain-containing protein [Bacteroidota bacterium]
MFALLLSFLFYTQPDADATQAASLQALGYKYEVSDSTSNNHVEIDNVFVIGNIKTKKKIILREMDVARGQSISEAELKELLEADRKKIINTRLFNDVELSILKLSETKVDVVVKVSERWYTWPAPIFKLVDRNFNDWWQNQNRDFSRVNYGLKLVKYNFRGRNETVKLTLQLGFTRNIELQYRVPYVDKAQRQGLSFVAGYSENNNIAVRTVNHKPVFLDSDDVLLTRRKFGLGYRFRNSFYSTHRFNIEYQHNNIADTIANLNTDYYLGGRTTQKFFSARYRFTLDRRDFAAYSLNGYLWNISALKLGLGIHDDIDNFLININHSKFIDLKKGYYFSNYSALQMSFPERQPYANLSALGFDKNFIRGYELFLIEGQNYYLNRTTFKKRILSTKKRIGLIPVRQFREIPLQIFFKTYFDMGYSENYEDYFENRTLSNRYLFGTGIGLDIVTYYDSVIRTELTANREGDVGFFLHFKKDF